MIHVDRLSKTFPLSGGNELKAVDEVSFTVAPGEVYGLLGPNGAGKTTTIRMILGLLRPTSGEAVISGYSSTREPNEVKRRVGLVSASAGLYQWLTTREQLLFFADLYGTPAPQAKTQLAFLAELLGLGSFLDRRCATLSTGQKQRVNLARALIHSPPVMLLDEPTLGLDPIGSQIVVEFVDHLRKRGCAIILTTHRLDEAERVCSRFGMLHLGKIAYEGSLQQLQTATGCTTLHEMFLKVGSVAPALHSAPEGVPTP